MFLFFFSFEIIYSHKVPMIWWYGLENKEPISRQKVVDLVYSRNSKFLRIRVQFLLTKSIFRSV